MNLPNCLANGILAYHSYTEYEKEDSRFFFLTSGRGHSLVSVIYGRPFAMP